MLKTFAAALSLLLALGVSGPGALAATSRAKYQSEHGARLARHHKRTPAQTHQRNLRYAHEHQARQHRHRAHMNAMRHHKGH